MKLIALSIFLVIFATDFVTSEIVTYQLSDRELVIDTELKENWYGADQWCRLNGMQLLKINSVEENEEINEFLYRQNLVHLWIAGNDLRKEGEWRWVSTLERLLFDRWMAGAPSNTWTAAVNEYEHCLELANHDVKNWNDATCRASIFLFICENVDLNRTAQEENFINLSLWDGENENIIEK